MKRDYRVWMIVDGFEKDRLVRACCSCDAADVAKLRTEQEQGDAARVEVAAVTQIGGAR